MESLNGLFPSFGLFLISSSISLWLGKLPNFKQTYLKCSCCVWASILCLLALWHAPWEVVVVEFFQCARCVMIQRRKTWILIFYWTLVKQNVLLSECMCSDLGAFIPVSHVTLRHFSLSKQWYRSEAVVRTLQQMSSSPVLHFQSWGQECLKFLATVKCERLFYSKQESKDH